MVSRRDIIGAVPSALGGALWVGERQSIAQPLIGTRTIVAAPTGNDIDVRQFGAVGDGRHDDTSAIDAAHNSVGGSESVACLRFPPGSYVYNGHGLRQSGGTIVVLGTPGAVSIAIKSDVYLFTCDGKIEQTYISGISIRGGKGLIKFTSEGENVSGFHRIYDCVFSDYTECAISNNSIDHPYLSIARCTFFGERSSRTIGVAWGGYIDALSIENCAFLLNMFHIKIGPRLSGSALIANNDFISFQRHVKEADVWIVPADGYVNSGTGIQLSHNKFGNENLDPDKPRILVAPEDYSLGFDRGTRGPALDDTKGYLRGLVISDNLIAGVSNMTAPFIRSSTTRFGQANVRDNHFIGGVHTYLVEFTDNLRAGVDRVDLNWFVRMGPSELITPQFSKGLSNTPIGLVRDDQVDPTLSTPMFLHPSLGDEAGFDLLASVFVPTDMHTRHATLRLNQSTPRSLTATFEDGDGECWKDLSPVRPGEMAWIDISAALVGRGLPEGRVHVAIEHSSGIIAAERILVVQPQWISVRIPFIVPVEPLRTGWRIRLSLNPHVINPLSDLRIGSLHVYHARQAMTSGHLRTLGTGEWNGEHIVLGRSHLWIDVKGKLRLSSGVPQADDDGRIIG